MSRLSKLSLWLFLLLFAAGVYWQSAMPPAELAEPAPEPQLPEGMVGISEQLPTSMSTKDLN